MKQVLARGGGVFVQDVPAPMVSPKNVLVQVRHSCVSVGTEISNVQMSGLPLYRRALKQPHHVKRALRMMSDIGVQRTISLIKGRLDAGSPLGYSAAGEVIDVGAEVEGFKRGDMVACAGAGIANHAELIDVPVNLATAVPSGLDLRFASTVTLGAIAMQGVRRLTPTLGEVIVVFGLGILGQIAVQLLKANGCVVIGTDINRRFIEIARQNGMDYGVESDGSTVDRIVQLTKGYGADGVLIAAATSSNEVIGEAFKVCRRKARVVLVGDVGLHIDRNDMYAKELDFLVSTSYGPGRYDADYEEAGRDYPLPYVRWTENRNMQEYLRLMAVGAIKLDNLPTEICAIDDAPAAYKKLNSPDRPLLVVLDYPGSELQRSVSIALKKSPPHPGRIRYALVGAGGFGLGVHMPNLTKLSGRYELKAVMSRTGANAVMAAKRFGAGKATTDFDEVINDPEIDLVLIATRHDQHAELLLRALRAGKHVFVEKPLAISESELQNIEAYFNGRSETPMLMTGFNRRFSPATRAVKKLLKSCSTPMIVNYRMNAGFIAKDHWVHGPQGGGRNIGEACHIYDLFNSLTESTYDRIEATAVVPHSQHWRRNDNFVVNVRYGNGSVCSLTYTALGDSSHPKERCEIFANGGVITLDDYRSVTLSSRRRPIWSSRAMEKGHIEEFRAFADGLHEGEWPITLHDQLMATRMSFEVERQLAT